MRWRVLALRSVVSYAVLGDDGRGAFIAASGDMHSVEVVPLGDIDVSATWKRFGALGNPLLRGFRGVYAGRIRYFRGGGHLRAV